jgi:hypothetical protein
VVFTPSLVSNNNCLYPGRFSLVVKASNNRRKVMQYIRKILGSLEFATKEILEDLLVYKLINTLTTTAISALFTA